MALNTHQRVVAELERLIFHQLEPGSELPSESELAGELSVSRLTVREAVKSLQARGLIDVRHGRRPVVAPLRALAVEDFFAVGVRDDPRNHLDLVEVRRALEVHIAALAARRVNRATSYAIENALAAMRDGIDDPDAFNLADVRFHEALAAASGNRMLSFLIEAMVEPLRASRAQSRRGHLARNRPLTAVIDEHALIYHRVISGDANGAAEAMREHLAQTERSLRKAMELTGNEDDLDRPLDENDLERT